MFMSTLIFAGMMLSFSNGAPAVDDEYPIRPGAFVSKVDDSVRSSAGQIGYQDESSDIVRGSYTMALPEGRTRTVKYTTDENGFHAAVITNELGKENGSPRDAALQASAISAAESVLKGAATFLRAITSDPNADGVYVQKRTNA